MKRAVAYLRVSSIKDRSRAISPEQQLDAVRRLAEQHGDILHDDDILRDWSRSGGKKLRERGSGSKELVRRIESGEVKAIYCYTSSRLGRNLSEALHLIDLADEHGVERIWSYKDGDLNPKTASGKFQRNVLAAADQMYRDEAVERGQANYEHRVERGDRIGVAPYGQMIDTETHRMVPNPDEDVSAVLEAYDRADGNFTRAAQLLSTDADLAPRARPRKGTFWTPTSLSRVVRRERDVPVQGAVSDGPKLVKDYALYRLLVCPHEHTREVKRGGKVTVEKFRQRLTAQRSKSGNGKYFVRYVCRNGVHDPSHPRPYSVSESTIIPWLEAALRAEGIDRVETRRNEIGPSGQSRDELEEDRRRAGIAFRARAMTEDEFAEEVARIDAALDNMPDDAEEGVPLVFTGSRALDLAAETASDPAGINQKLRRALDHIELDAQMRPVRAAWK